MDRKLVNNPTTLKINGDELRVIQDNEEILKCLKNGESVVHWEGGYSLHPIIQNMEYCKISPIKPEDVEVGMCVFCRLENGVLMVHRVNDIITRNGVKWFKIGDTWDTTYGWTPNVFGLAESTDYFQAYQEKEKWYEKVAKNISIFL